MSFLATFPEIDGILGTLRIRYDIENKCMTIGLKEFQQWHPDTEQVQISDSLIHFIEPGSAIVGVKVFSAGGES